MFSTTPASGIFHLSSYDGTMKINVKCHVPWVCVVKDDNHQDKISCNLEVGVKNSSFSPLDLSGSGDSPLFKRVHTHFFVSNFTSFYIIYIRKTPPRFFLSKMARTTKNSSHTAEVVDGDKPLFGKAPSTRSRAASRKTTSATVESEGPQHSKAPAKRARSSSAAVSRKRPTTDKRPATRTRPSPTPKGKASPKVSVEVPLASNPIKTEDRLKELLPSAPSTKGVHRKLRRQQEEVPEEDEEDMDMEKDREEDREEEEEQRSSHAPTRKEVKASGRAPMDPRIRDMLSPDSDSDFTPQEADYYRPESMSVSPSASPLPSPRQRQPSPALPAASHQQSKSRSQSPLAAPPHLSSPGRYSYSKSSPPPIPEPITEPSLSATPSPGRRADLKDSQFLSQNASQELPLDEAGSEESQRYDDVDLESEGRSEGDHEDLAEDDEDSEGDEYAGNIDAPPAVDEDDPQQDSMEDDLDGEPAEEEPRPRTQKKNKKAMRQQLMPSMSAYKKPMPFNPHHSSPVKHPRLYETGRSSPMKALPQRKSSFRTSDDKVHSHLTVSTSPCIFCSTVARNLPEIQGNTLRGTSSRASTSSTPDRGRSLFNSKTSRSPSLGATPRDRSSSVASNRSVGSNLSFVSTMSAATLIRRESEIPQDIKEVYEAVKDELNWKARFDNPFLTKPQLLAEARSELMHHDHLGTGTLQLYIGGEGCFKLVSYFSPVVD